MSSSIRANLSLLAASYSLMRPALHFFVNKKFFLYFRSCVRKKWIENRELHNSCEKWLRKSKKNCFETIVKNCLYVIHYEKFVDDLSNSCGDFLDAAVPRAFWGARKKMWNGIEVSWGFLFIFISRVNELPKKDKNGILMGIILGSLSCGVWERIKSYF